MRFKTKRTAKTTKKRSALLVPRKRFCRFCVDKNKIINYKEIKTLEVFIKERGKIVSRRFTGNCARHQRRLAQEIKRARFISLIPYSRVM